MKVVIYYNPENTKALLLTGRTDSVILTERIDTSDFNNIITFIRENDLPYELIEHEEGIDTVVGTRPPSSKH